MPAYRIRALTAERGARPTVTEPAAHGCEGPQTLTHGSVIAVILERRSIQLSQLAGPFWRKPHAIFCSLKLRQMPGVFTPSPDHRNDLLV
jgi:hypothetical protein